MSQNQSYFWQTTRHNVFLKRSAKLQLLFALLAVLTYSAVCLAEIEPKFNEGNIAATESSTTISNAVENKLAQPDMLDEKSSLKEDNSKNVPISNNGFIDAFAASISVILVTELGDKTFFIAAIMAMSHPRSIVFAGAIAALSLMTVLSVVFGIAATIIPKVYTYYISTALFAIFGLKMIYDGYVMKSTDAQEELQEVQSDLRKRQEELMGSKRDKYDESGVDAKRKNSNSDSDNETEVFLESGQRSRDMIILKSFSNSSSSNQKIRTNCDNKFVNSNTNNYNNTLQEITRTKHGKRTNIDGSMTMVHSLNNAKTNDNTLSSTNNIIESDTNINLEKENKRRLERNVTTQDPESGALQKNAKKNPNYLSIEYTQVFMQALTMTFLAEWGDRSQLTTIILAASKNVYGVITGGIIGHSICTGLAVIGGRMVAAKISVKTVTIVGGIVFLGFALYALIIRPDDI